MRYTEKYSTDDIFDMFANQADFDLLARQEIATIASDLLELAPDMEDAQNVAHLIKACAITHVRVHQAKAW